MLYLGCPLWGCKEWVGNFFPTKTPAGDFLKLYSERVNVVEGNTTFYALPSAQMIARWIHETPSNFRFCPKISSEISHKLPLDDHQKELAAFVERLRGLGERLGPMFLQLPPHFTPRQLPQLANFLEQWPPDLRLAVEVRHLDFFKEPHEEDLNTLLGSRNIGRVMMDVRPIQVGSKEEQRTNQSRERKPILPLHVTTTTDFAFLRYIGHPRMEVNEPLLDAWSVTITQWLKQGTTPYIFCHCPFEIHSPQICERFYEKLKTGHSLPALFKEQEPEIQQGRLF